MIEDIVSLIILILDTTYDIMLPLWLFLIIGAIASTIIEKIDFLKNFSTNVFWGSLLGIISPLSTIYLVKSLKPGKASTAMIYSSLLANPILLIMIYANLGIKSTVVYFLIVFFVGIAMGNLIKHRPDIDDAPKYEKKVTPLLSRFWIHLSFAGFYTIIGAVVAATMRTLIAFTYYNNSFLNTLPYIGAIKPLFILSAAPVYSCGGAWIPILKEIGALGLNMEALLAFILFGQATRIGHLLSLREVYQKRDIIGYVAFVGVISVIMGLTF